MGTLYLVATPIGNLEDITQRALRTLERVNLIAAEDTRRTARLLAHFGIRTPLTSYFEHNKLSKIDVVLQALESGDVALVSDAGTPALNDPGYELVRAALQHGCNVSAIPGPSAPVAALVVSGLPTNAFLYLGYLPRKKNERLHLLARVADQPYTLVFLESPHRLLVSLQAMLDVFGDRQVCVARELTKLHEEILRLRLSEALDYFQNQAVRGEFTLVVAGTGMPQSKWPETRLRATLQQELLSGESLASLATQISLRSGWPRREVYKLLHQMQPTA